MLKAEVERECKRLWLVIEMIRKVESERKASAAGDGTGKVARLVRLAGLGEVSAHVLVNEVFHRDFANRRQVGAYFGLVSSPYNSGTIVREQGISRAGNRRARYTAVELAWLWRLRAPLRAGCATSPPAAWPVGSMNASARPAGVSGAS